MKAIEALRYIAPEKFCGERMEPGAAGCPNTYFDGAKCLCNLPGRAGKENCRACWNQEVRIPDGPAEDPGKDMQTFTIEKLAFAVYNTVSKAVEDFGGNADGFYRYTRGVCDLVDELAALVAGDGDA